MVDELTMVDRFYCLEVGRGFAVGLRGRVMVSVVGVAEICWAQCDLGTGVILVKELWVQRYNITCVVNEEIDCL